MKTVRQVLKEKGGEIHSVSPDDTVYDALRIMADCSIGAVLVLEDARPVGIFSERDYARKIILREKRSWETRVREVMTSALLYVHPTQTVEECMALITRKRVRHLPVLDEGELVGLVSIGDVVKAVIHEKEFLIEQLENYIKSG